MNKIELVKQLRNWGNQLTDQYGCIPVMQALILEAAERIEDDITELQRLREALELRGEIIGELLDRGDFDPFLPFSSILVFATPRPVRTYDSQNAWEAILAEKAAALAGSTAPSDIQP